MKVIEDSFKRIEKSKDPEEINDFLIDIGKNPREERLKYVDFFMGNLDVQLFEKVKLSLIYAIGQIGNLTPIDDRRINFLIDTYFKSDRWVRNEIIQTAGKIGNSRKLPDNLVSLITKALNEEYVPIKLSALKVLLKLDNLPSFGLKNLFWILNSSDSNIREEGIRVLNKFILDEIQLFDVLDDSQNYKILKKDAIRAILINYFTSDIDLEQFKEKISNSTWEQNYKEHFVSEIESFEKLLLKKHD